MRLSYANVAATLALVFCVVGTAVASSNGGSPGSISKVCADRSGNLSLPTRTGACRHHGHIRAIAGTPGPSGATGAQGPASAGPTTQLTSPDGRFEVAVTNAGITLSGPETSVKLTAKDLTMSAGLSTSLTSGTSTSLTSGTSIAVTSGAPMDLTAGGPLALTAGGTFTLATNEAAELLSPRVSLGGASCSKALGGSTIVFAC